MSQPTIRQWLTPAGFATAVPELAAYPLPAISHALAMARSTAVPVLDAPPVDGGPAVYVVTPSHVLLVDAVRDDDPHGGRFVRLPAPLGGSAVGVPVPVVDTDTLLARLRGGVGDCYLLPPDAPTGHVAYHDRSAHEAIGALAGAAAMARVVMAGDSNQDLTLILPALGSVLEDLSAVADGLTPYCGDFAEQAEARLATITALLADSAAMARRAHDDVAARLHLDRRMADLRLTDILLRPEPDGDGWAWHANGHLTDTRTGPGACHATIITTQAHPDMAAAIDAVRDVARRFAASRPDPRDRTHTASAIHRRASAAAELGRRAGRAGGAAVPAPAPIRRGHRTGRRRRRHSARRLHRGLKPAAAPHPEHPVPKIQPRKDLHLMDRVRDLLATAADDVGWEIDLDQLPVTCAQVPALVLPLIEVSATHLAATAGVAILDEAAASLRTVIGGAENGAENPVGDWHIRLLAEVLDLTDTQRRHVDRTRRRLLMALQALQSHGATWPPQPQPPDPATASGGGDAPGELAAALTGIGLRPIRPAHPSTVAAYGQRHGDRRLDVSVNPFGDAGVEVNASHLAGETATVVWTARLGADVPIPVVVATVRAALAPHPQKAAEPAEPAGPTPQADINRYAEHIMAAIDDDIAEGGLPGSVACFTDLHDYVDANDYLQGAGVPMPTADGGIDTIVAVQDEVTRRLSAPGRRHCTHGACPYPRHDHTTTQGPDGAELDEPIAMRCGHCGQPAHYDDKLSRYRHDDPAAPDCFLISRNPQ